MPTTLFFFPLFVFFLFNPISCTEFIFNSFNSTSLLLRGGATIQSSILTLTTDQTFSVGRALFAQPIPTRFPNSSRLLPFSTSFIFSISPYPGLLPGHGLAFILAPTSGINGTSSSQNLGLLNFTNNGNPRNHLFAVKFDVFQNQEFNDISDNHVGVNLNSLTSIVMREAGYWVENVEDGFEFRFLKLNNGENYQVWIDYMDSRINVTMAPAGMERPKRAMIDFSINISDVFLDQMYVGFSAATGGLVESHRIVSWSFSHSNSSIGDALITKKLPSFVASNSSSRSKGFIIVFSVGGPVAILGGVVYVLLLVRRGRKKNSEKELEDWELEYWPHRMEYKEICASTNGFADNNIIGRGGNGTVYKGVLAGGVEVAVKSISVETEPGTREFVAEISSLGRLKHRNLVGLRGWCKNKTEKRKLFLVYDYMENSSLDKWLFDNGINKVLDWNQRIKVLKDVASGILYLHEGWEVRVLHRDIKSSNVLLDKDMDARLADFGLARMHHHEQLASTTRLVGTVGYMAPELLRTGRPSAQTDVFSFGVLVLEVVSGRKPIEEGKQGLVEWGYGLMRRGELIQALDERLNRVGGFSEMEVEKVLQLGLQCTNPEPNARPTMRMVSMALAEKLNGRQIYDMDNMEMASMWSYYNDVGAGYPTYEDVQNRLMSSSMSLSELEGR